MARPDRANPVFQTMVVDGRRSVGERDLGMAYRGFGGLIARRDARDAPQVGVLLGEDIRRLRLLHAPDGGSLDQRCFKAASFDMRLGRQAVRLEGQGSDGPGIFDCSRAGILRIPRFGAVVVSTYERVRLPPNVVGKFNLRIKLALKGLVVQMGTQVEPNYDGILCGLLQNISDSDIEIRYADYDDRIFTIEFHYTASGERLDPSAGAKTYYDLGQIMPTGSARGTLNTITTSLETQQTALSSTTDELQKTQRRLSEFNFWRVALVSSIAMTVVATLAAAVLSVAGPIYYQLFQTYLQADVDVSKATADRLGAFEERMRLMREELELLSRAVDEGDRELGSFREDLQVIDARLRDLPAASSEGVTVPVRADDAAGAGR